MPSRAKCGFCVPVHSVARSARTSATAQAGPMLACDWNGHSYSASTIRAALAKAGSISPVASGTSRLTTGAWRMWSTSNTSVYVCGDAVATSPQLSPIATYEGRIVGRNIVEGPKHTPDYTSIPSCVFTVPGLASVGLTQAAAEEKGLELRVEVNDMHEWLSGRSYAATAAWAKVLVHRQ